MKLHTLLGREIRKTAFLSWVQMLLKVPSTVIMASLTASVVSYAASGQTTKLLYASGAALLFVLLLHLLMLSAKIAYRKLETTALHRCKLRLYRQILSAPLFRLYETDHGDLIQTIDQDLNTAAEKRTTLYPSVFAGLITAVTYSILIGLQSPLLVLVLFLFGLFQLVPPLIVRKKLQLNYDENRAIEAEEANYIYSGIDGFSLIKLYDLKRWWLSGLSRIHKKEMDAGSKCESANTVEHILYQLADAVLKYGTYIAVGIFALFELISIEAGVQAIALSGDLYAAIKTVCSRIPDFAIAKQAESHLKTWLDTEESADAQITDRNVSFSDVSVQYNGSTVLSGFSAEFDASNVTLIKGTNGSGKSTLLRLMTGLLTATDGTVQIGGCDPTQLSAGTFPGSIFYLPQDDPLFDFTAQELYAMLAIEDAAARIAARFSLTNELLSDTKIRELSGGERKKVFLSLAFAMDPSVLFMDEPTNSLDMSGKAVLKQLLAERNGGAILITHDTIFNDLPDRTVFTMGGDRIEAN